jgi:capsule polysaccharide export protein KpsE/RkpR
MQDDVMVRKAPERGPKHPYAAPAAHELSFTGTIQLLLKYWRLFAVVALAALILSAIFSGPTFIKPRYRSTATVYPVNLNSYSIETRTDQLLQLLESNSIRDSLIKKFDLVKVYDVDTVANGGYYALYNEFADRVDISKTRYESVQIEVVDEDPWRARDLVSAMLDQVNLLARRLQREKSLEVLGIAERAMKHERQKLDSVEARLHQLRQGSGLLAYEAQARELTKGYVRMLGSNDVSQAKKDEVQAMIREMELKGGEFRQLTELSDLFRGNYDRLLTDYEKAYSDVTKELTYTNVVVHPEVSDKKVYPVRWLIVSTSTLSALLLLLVLLAWKERRMQ